RHLPQDIVLDNVSETLQSKISYGKAKAKGLIGKNSQRLVGLAISENSDWDTGYFGKQMGRLAFALFDDVVAPDQRSRVILSSFDDEGFQMVSARVNLRDLGTIQALEADGGILTDVLLTFRFDAETQVPEQRASKIEIGPARKDETGELIKLGGRIFS